MSYRWLDETRSAIVYALPGRVVVDTGAILRKARAGEIKVDPPGPLEVDRSGLTLTPPQLFAGLAAEGWITEAEALAWAQSNTLPQAALDVIATLPTAQQLIAKVRLYRMSEARRDDPLVAALGAAEGKTDVELDEFFQTYAKV